MLPDAKWISQGSLIALNFSEVIFSSAWVISGILATATEFFRFFGSPPAFSVCWKAHQQTNLQLPFFDEKGTHVDAHNHRHFLLTLAPFLKGQHVGWTPFLKDSYPLVWLTFLESWTEYQSPFLWSHIFSRGRVSFHTSLLKSIDLSNIYLSFALRLTCGCSRARLFELYVTRREMLLTNCRFKVLDNHLF